MEDYDIEDQYKNQERKLRSHIEERICESEVSVQCEENLSLISNLSLNKRTFPGVKPWEHSVHREVFIQHSSCNRHIICHTGHNPYEYQKPGEKPCKCKVSSQEDSIHLLEPLVTKGHTASKETLQFVQTQVDYLEPLMSEQGPHLDPVFLLLSSVPVCSCCLLTLDTRCSRSTHFPSDVSDNMQTGYVLTSRDKRLLELEDLTLVSEAFRERS
ncbi:zinc finger protein 14-like [Rousettus aegyptiacus]|uniref:zinc finger protein 14-like n=1 Tax=Rousettus aegyptiacus TaxID=9407 RepID=UPI00168D3307|nr:zinc finger protein 14-like [Rousettus aegyptiacus]XP_016008884.2 zinc finger protein 14-like [Rousettus aegyptiacus]XP_016008886.2 zinc finger protein 14-like [Rousettus aegyptiacus]XP_016008887.2 zinc finger protein 14-like [Rousettus aegyptiacus]XP_036089553.1 zinc finger protein 14-like [Rousettus aegyptiacus]XP_036089554.1 zinc finger protein 14-like [Rousettus aegyptiacus]XP_036089555.1 zinc finger protein 14-like [Rousettus aegyptiacus]XP_036089556.1 zinc finger protein 14-like [Ro